VNNLARSRHDAGGGADALALGERVAAGVGHRSCGQLNVMT
jgi:hypothetical protein